MTDIVGLGEAVIDWVVTVPHFPIRGEKVDAISEGRFPGGVVANYLVAASRLGAPCRFIGAVGKDIFGTVLIRDFVNEGIDISPLKTKGTTPVNYIFIHEGEKSIIQSPFMYETKLRLKDIKEKYIKKAKVLHTSLIHPELSRKAIEIAKKYNVKISIDLEPQITKRGWDNIKDMVLQADILFVSKGIIEKFSYQKLPIVIESRGAYGIAVYKPTSWKKYPAIKVDNIVDTTGAGDTFAGAFSVAFWIKGMSLEDSIKYGMRAASLKIQKLGARAGMPYAEDMA